MKNTSTSISPWYKYLPRKYARSLVEEGKVRIGTLYDYKSVEMHGDEVGDRTEGQLTEWSADKKPKRASEANRLEKMAIKAGPGLILANNYVEIKHESPNVYLFCASEVFSTEIMIRMSADCNDQYDACVMITDPASFMKEIVEAFKDEGKFIDGFRCVYMGRRQHYSVNAPHPATIKDPRYQYQAEVRGIWEPLFKNSIDPKILIVPEIRRFCRMHYEKSS